jgi:pSer/pThr/pTyr-binding forkhead associated (FHA) protein
MDVQLKDSEVSRRHAMIEVAGDEAALLDLGATNGTYVDGQRIDRTQLGNRAEFTVGSTTLMFIVAASRDTG